MEFKYKDIQQAGRADEVVLKIYNLKRKILWEIGIKEKNREVTGLIQ